VLASRPTAESPISGIVFAIMKAIVAAMVNAKIEDCEKVEAAPHRATLSQAG